MNRDITKAGHIEFDGERATLVFERRLCHPIQAVWEAITDPDQLAQWFVKEASVERRLSGEVRFLASPMPIEWTGSILAWGPPTLFEYEFNTPQNPHMPQRERSIARWELRESNGDTVLLLRHSRLTRPTATGFAPGAHAFLDRLESLLDGAPLPHWQERYAEVAPAYARWSAL